MTSHRSSPTVVSLAELGDPVRLEPLVRAVHGQGDRAPGWFARKLHREHVCPVLSRVAVDTGAPAPLARTEPDHWIGYVLVAAAPRTTAARTCGGGVIPDRRGEGLGRALFEAAIAGVASAGYERLIVPAAVHRVGFFERLGFVRGCESATLLTFATGPRDAVGFGEGEPWNVEGALVQLAGWLPEAWTRTEASARATDHIEDVVVHLAREGVAVMAHRVLAPPGTDAADVTRALEQLRARVAAPTPLLVTGMPPEGPLAASMLRHGWTEVQRGVLMHRTTARRGASVIGS